MEIGKVFFDANIFNDIFDHARPMHLMSKTAFAEAMKREIKIFTSCDIATNIYYITTKYTSGKNALEAIEHLKNIAEIIPFGEKELTRCVQLMRNDADYKDLEDTIQYILALETGCDLIVTNDARFVAKEIESVSAEAFVKRYLS